MAIESVCAKLLNDIDASCNAPARRYWQQAVLINKSDIETSTLNFTDFEGDPVTCSYNITFALKCETKGIRIRGIETGESFKGWFSKSRDANGYSTYNHQVSVFISGTSEEIKCTLDALSKGSYVVALQTKSGVVEIYGWENGLSTGDFDYDIQANGGGAVITLQSLDVAPENYLPMVYKAELEGDEIADFDAAFAGPETCA